MVRGKDSAPSSLFWGLQDLPPPICRWGGGNVTYTMALDTLLRSYTVSVAF